MLGAKDENHTRVDPLFAGFIKILPVFLFVLPGLMCYALVQNGTLDVAGMAQKDGVPDTQDTYAFMIRELLPIGLRGVITAALLAALMGKVYETRHRLQQHHAGFHAQRASCHR